MMETAFLILVLVSGIAITGIEVNILIKRSKMKTPPMLSPSFDALFIGCGIVFIILAIFGLYNLYV